MGSKIARWLTSPAAIVGWCLLVTVVAALAANLSLELWHTGGNTTHVWSRLTEELPLFLLGSLLIWLVVVLLVAVLGRLWLGVGITLVAAGLLGYADHVKRELLSEPVFPSDLAAFPGDAGFLTQMVGTRVVVTMVAVSLLALAGALLLGRLAGKAFPHPDRRTHPRLAWGLVGLRVVVAVVAFASLAYTLQFHSPGNYVRAAYERYGAHWRPWHQTMNYTDNGVVAGILYNLPMPAMAPPPGYSQEAMRELVARYSAAALEINTGRDPEALADVNVLSILSESLSDPTRYGPVQLAEDPLPFTRRLMARTTSGNMLTEKYGGGTANVEFEILTGMSISQFRPQLTTPYQMLVPHYAEFPSAVRFFEGRGLRSETLHSYTSTLYRRAEVYPVLGFDEIAFEDDMRYTARIDDSRFISDEATFREVLDRLGDSDDPVFFNVVTMQNHFPTAGKYDDPIPALGMPDRDTDAHLEHYARGLRHSDDALAELLEGLEASGEKTVLVIYGDHLPPIWHDTGMTRRMKHETPFLVYSTFGGPQAEPLPTTDPVHLVNHVLEAAGAPVSPYYALLAELETQVPAMTHDYFIDPTNVQREWEELPPTSQQVLDDYRMVQYDLSVGRRYSEKAMFALPLERPPS